MSRTYVLLCLLASAVAAAPNVPPPAQQEPILITGATIHTVPGTAIENGKMLFRDGRIEENFRGLQAAWHGSPDPCRSFTGRETRATLST